MKLHSTPLQTCSRFILKRALALVLTLVTPALTFAAEPGVSITGVGPLANITVGQDGSFQIVTATYPGNGEVYPPGLAPGDAGFFLRHGGKVDGINLNRGGSAAAGSASIGFNSISQTLAPGQVTTVMDNSSDGTGVNFQVTQVTSYNTGDNWFLVQNTVSNENATAQSLDMFAAADIYLADSDAGYGYLNTSCGPVAIGGSSTAAHTYNIFVQASLGSLAPTSYEESGYGTIWNIIGTGANFNDTLITGSVDNGAGLEWQGVTIPAHGVVTVSYYWGFGNITCASPGTNVCSDGCITIQAPNDLVVNACANNCAVADFTAIGADTCCGNPVTLSYNPPSGSCFPVGTTSVQITASDSCGHNNSCTFNVIVVQNTDSPVITSYPTNIIICAGFSNICGTMPNDISLIQATTALPGGGLIITQSISPGTLVCSDTNVTFTAIDSCGDSTNVDVPVYLTNCCISFVAPTNIVVDTCTNSRSVFFSVTAHDQCCGSNGAVTIVSMPPSGYDFPLGTTVVTNVATDGCNSNYWTFPVIVVQNGVAPVFGCVSPPPNLVPNGDFESFSSCPTTFSQIQRATPWFQPTAGTPDFFNSCAPSSSGISTPANFVGNAVPHSGNGYVGGTAYTGNTGGPPGTGSREYIEVPLSASLIAGRSYQVSFYVSLASDSYFAIDSMGAYFSVGPLQNHATSQTLSAVPQIQNFPGQYLTTIGTWTLISGSFTAAGGENYLTIGNFNDDDHTASTLSGGPYIGSMFGSFYYVDDVSVSNQCGCPGDKSVVDGSGWMFDTPTAYDPQTGDNVNVTVLSTVTNSFCPLTIKQTWQAMDACGNSSLCSQTVTVLDRAQIQSSNLVVSACGPIPVFFNPTVTDPCCPGLVAGCNPPSGSTFPLGTTMVSCSVTNCFGEITVSNFTVEVTRAILNQTNIVLTSCTNLQVFYNPSVDGNCCSGWQPLLFPPSGSIFNIGTTTTVNCIEFDSCHDTNFTTFTVTILPGTNCSDCLQIFCPSNISVLTCSNCAVVNFAARATNLCCPGPVNLAYSPLSPGSCFPLGTTPVQVTATDNCTNTLTCSFNVTVTQNTCPPIISVGPTNIVLCAGPSGCVPMPDEVHAIPNTYSLNNTGVSGVFSSSPPEALPIGTLSDPHWTLISVPTPPAASPLEFGTNAQVQVNSSPQWLTPDIHSAWIGPANDASNNAPEGDYDYQTTFILPADGSFTISGQLAASDYVSDIRVNGSSTGAFSAKGASAAQWNPFTISGAWFAGTNTLDFIVHNSPTIGNNPPTDNLDSPSGLLVEFNTLTLQPISLYTPAAVQATNCDGTSAPGWQSIPPGTILCGNTNITFVFTNACGQTTSYTAAIIVENCCVSPPPSMVLWLTLDESTGDTCLNSAGYNNGIRISSGTYARNNTGPSHNPGQYVNNSLCFGGSRDLVNVSDYPAIEFSSQNFSMDAWVKWEGGGGTFQSLVEHRTEVGASVFGYQWFLSNGVPGLQLATGNFYNFVAAHRLPTNVWTHLAATVQRGGTSVLHFYTNGVLSDTFNLSGVPGSISTVANLVIGNSQYATEPLNGCMDEIELFNRVLLPYQIYDIYGAGHAGKCRPTCTIPAVSTMCFNASSVTVPVKICNSGSTTLLLNVSFNGLSAVQAGGSPAINGPTASSFTGYPSVVTLPPGSCTNFTVTIQAPPGLATTNFADYQMTILDPSGQRFSSVGQIKKIFSVWCSVVNPVTNVFNWSQPTNLVFVINNPSNTPITFTSQVAVLDRNFELETNIISLNGFAPGVPITNQFTVPANGSIPVAVNVNYLDSQPWTPFYLVLSLNIGDDGALIPVASAAFAQIIPPTVGPPIDATATNGQVVVSWDAVNTGWNLLSTTNLTGTNWIPVNLPVLPLPDGSQGVTLPRTNQTQFFQLIGPGSP